jgi:hypothetical protein
MKLTLLPSTPLCNVINISVANIVFANFFGKMFNVPLKTDEHSHGLITEWEFFETTGAIFTFLFFNGDEGSGLKLKNGTQQAYDQLEQLLKLNVTAVKDLGGIDKAIDDLKNQKGFVKLYGDNLIRRMLKAGYSIDSVVVQILLTSTGTANLSTQVHSPVSLAHFFQFPQILDLFLSPEYADDWKAVKQLAKSNNADSLATLTRYVMEAMRISSAAAGVTRTLAHDTAIQDGPNRVTFNTGETMFIDLVPPTPPQKKSP